MFKKINITYLKWKEVRKMNNESKLLLKSFDEMFPKAGFGIFKMTVKSRLKGTGVNEDYKNLSAKTASRLKSLYAGISEESLRDWCFGLMMNESKGICQIEVNS